MTGPALFPAIDLLGGKCVRLLQGDYDRETVYGDDPVAQALAFVEAGATWVHVVDLDAARSGEPVNRTAIAAVAAAVPVPVQTGGGVRTVADAQGLFDAGVARVVMGTAAIEDPSLVAAVAAHGRVAVGLDVRGREVALRGWTEGSGQDILDAADRFAGAGADALVVTQIARDGTLDGPDVEGLGLVLGHLAATGSPLGLVASGGVGTLADLAVLRTLQAGGRICDGVIVGRALYEGRFGVAEAVGALAGGEA
jgi:phosphoribosylformimino-5-aminoimidazole carboxamide ribotide isomerase